VPAPSRIGFALDLSRLALALSAAGLPGDAVKRARDLRTWFRDVVDADFTALMEKQFASEGRELLGYRWRKLAAATVKKKGHNQILIDSQQMADAFVDPDAPGGYRTITRAGYARGVRGRLGQIADYHMTGTARMPARPILPPSGNMPARITKAWADSLADFIATGHLTRTVT